MNNIEKRRIKSLRPLPGFGLSLRNKKSLSVEKKRTRKVEYNYNH